MRSRKAGFPFATRARKREPCLQRYVSRMTRTENFLTKFFLKFFWKPLFSTFYGTLFIISRKYFFGFLKSAPTLRYINQKVQLQLDKSKSPAVAGLFIANKKKSSHAAGLIKKSPPTPRYTNQKVQLQLDKSKSPAVVYKGYKFSKSIFFQSFSGNHFSPRFLVPFSLLAENISSVFRSTHLPLDTPFWTRGFPLVMRSRKAGFPFATRARKREPCLQRYVSRMTRTENFLTKFF